jgi:hypothetical protein
MTTLLSRQFTVDWPLEKAWQHLARVKRRPPGPSTSGKWHCSHRE